MCCSSRSFTLINKIKQLLLLYMNSTLTDQSAMTLTTDVVYKYDGDTDIVTKYLTNHCSQYFCNSFYTRI